MSLSLVIFGSLIAYGLGRSLGNSAIKAITGKTVTFATHQGHAVISGLIFLTRLVPIWRYNWLGLRSMVRID